MTTKLRKAVAASAAVALVSIASAQITTPIPATNLFSDPGPPNKANFQAGLGDLYFASSDDASSTAVAHWNTGPVNFAAAGLGSNPFNAQGGSVSVIFLGKTAGWANDLLVASSAAPTTFVPLVTSIEDVPADPTSNIFSGYETQVAYSAGASLDFFLNSGGDLGLGGLFSAFGGPNYFSGDDQSSHVRWSERDVPTNYFNGVSNVTTAVPTLLVGFEDVRQGISFNDSDFNDLVVAFQFLPIQNPVPEPSTYGLMGAAGLLGLVAFRRSKRQVA